MKSFLKRNFWTKKEKLILTISFILIGLFISSFSQASFLDRFWAMLLPPGDSIPRPLRPGDGWSPPSLLVYTNSPIYCKNHNVWGWAWSENIGWISFNCANTIPINTGNDFGVDIDPTTGLLSGYAWSEHIGWISFNQSDLTGCPTPPCQAKLDLNTMQVSGWAKALAGGTTGSGGWDGWIRLRGGSYGVSLELPSKQFLGWAFGGDDSPSTAVVGWISFNCRNTNPASACCAMTTSSPCVYTTLNFPPRPPTELSEDINSCGWGSIPQVAPGLTITLNWFYSDLDNNNQVAYEISISDGENEATTQKSGSAPPNSTSSYVLNLSDFGDWRNSQCSYPNFGYGLCFNKTYYWKVRVKDSGGDWSGWSEIKSFLTPPHPFPYVNFKWVPSKPTVNEVAQFCSMATGTCETIITQEEESKCYDSSANVSDCSSWNWNFESGNPSTSTFPNPTTTFIDIGSKQVTLTISDQNGNSCTVSKTVSVTYPLPKWKEIPPISFFENPTAFLTNVFEFVKVRLTSFF